MCLSNLLYRGGGIFYIDVGANHPIKESVTEWLYRYANASGINIEPQKESFELLNSYRKRDINICAAAGAQPGLMPLYVNDDHSGCATLNREYTDNTKIGKFVQTKNVNVITLNEIWDEYVNQEVHFIKIDVEGYEKDVLEGLDLEIKRPWIICAECVKPFYGNI